MTNQIEETVRDILTNDTWILSTDEKECPECKAAIEQYRKILANHSIDWSTIAVLYATDFNGEFPGSGGLVEVGK